ncbi:MAG: hypothetical protein NVS1B2_26970 [Vulcanimicrobiaceae bacterium]
MTVSDFITTLVHGETPLPRPAAGSELIALAANRVVRAIDALKPYEADNDAAADAIGFLRAAQGYLADEQERAVATYDAATTPRHGIDDHWGDG